MKVPAVWIAGAFAAGIALRPAGASAAILLIAAAAMVFVGALAAKFGRAGWPAAILALAAWCALGAASVSIEQSAVPRTSVARLLASKALDTSEPLRWRGRLREDPSCLPWGARYTVDLEAVETAGAFVPVTGGLRANYFWKRNAEEELAALRAGDRVEVLLRARQPRNYMDPGAPDTRAMLAREGVDLIGTLRSAELLQLLERPAPTLGQRLARARGVLLNQIERTFAASPEVAAILRAMLLGDRTFVDSNVALDFQKTGAFHVLVLAGLHVGVLCAFFLWIGRKLRAPVWLAASGTLFGLILYVGVVQDRPPILRAALMAAFFLLARPLYRRVALLNLIAIAAIILLAVHPSLLRDVSFELSFVAAGSIAGLALPWMERTSERYIAGLIHLDDHARDSSFPAKVVQFRIDLRAVVARVQSKLPARIAPVSDRMVIWPLRAGLRLWELFVLSLALQAGMLALLAFDFHRVTLAGPASNVLAVLLTSVIVPLGFVTLGVSLIWQRLAAPLAWILEWMVKMLLASVHWFATLPRMSFRAPAPSLWLIGGTLIALCALCILARAHKLPDPVRLKRRLPRAALQNASSGIAMRACEFSAAAIFGGFLLLVAVHPFGARLPLGHLEVTALDVGQGDSIFAAFPDGHTMLIDGGGEPGSTWTRGVRSGSDVGEEVVAPYLWSRGLKRLDVVALTHAHHDHLDGLRAVLNDFAVGELWIGADSEAAAFRELLDEAHARGVRIVHRHALEQFQFGGVHGEILWPPPPGDAALTANNDSMVILLQDGATRFLLPGDIEAPAEHALSSEGIDLNADFLKVPHHGSKSSSTEGFLEDVAPRFAVISVGEGNPFGHPNDSVVERYQEHGTKLWRTDEDGAVTAVSDGRVVTVRSYREASGVE